jgi:phosphoserine phosphatase RsbU/P
MIPDSNRILLAEDHYVSRHLLERNLSNWGYQVTTVEDGEAAVRIFESATPPALAIIDWMMPQLDGLEVCRCIRAIRGQPYVYVILLTAKTGKDEIATGFEAGADDYMIKPFDPDELRARLKVGQRVLKLQRELAARVSQLEAALADVKRLTGLLPLCIYCKRIREDGDYWQEIEHYIREETGADFSHSICPDCLGKLKSEDPHTFSVEPGSSNVERGA